LFDLDHRNIYRNVQYMNLVKSYVPLPQKLYHLTRRLGTLDGGGRDCFPGFKDIKLLNKIPGDGRS
jgi:hypothetical protein